MKNKGDVNCESGNAVSAVGVTRRIAFSRGVTVCAIAFGYFSR